MGSWGTPIVLVYVDDGTGTMFEMEAIMPV